MAAMESTESEIVVVSPDISENFKVKPGHGSKSSTGPCQKYYKQMYRTSWESQPDFQGWLKGVEGQPSRAYCSYCQVTLFAHRLSLLKHTCTRKHQKSTHRIFLKQAEKDASGNDTDDEVDPGDCINPEDQHAVDDEMDGANESSNAHLTLKSKTQPASGMTVTIIREDGSTDPLHLQVTDVSHVNESSGTVPVSTVESKEGTVPITVVQSSNRTVPVTVVESGRTLPLTVMESAQPETSGEKAASTSHSSAETDRTPFAESTMAQTRSSPLTTHVLDTANGAPVHNINVSLYRLIDGRWTLVNESTTTADGRCNELIPKPNFVSGRYKLHFDVHRYFELQGQETMYPFVEIVFDVHTPQVHYHIPLLISPFGYTTYRGS